MTQSALQKTDDMPTPFPRWLPLIGVIIGLSYLAIIGLTRDMFGDPPAELPFTMSRLAYSGPAIEMNCDLADNLSELKNSHPIWSPTGLTPEVYALQFSEAPRRSVLAFDLVPDIATFLNCLHGQQVGDIQILGDQLAFSERKIQTSQGAFEVDSATSEHIYLLHIVQGTARTFPLKLMERNAFLDKNSRSLKIHIGFISVLAFMIVYNLVLAGLTNMHAFAFNALTMLSLLFLNLHLSGLGLAYLWPESPELTNTILILSLAGITIFAPLFMYKFIVPSETNLWQAKPILLAWPIITILILFGTVFLPNHYVINSLVALLSIMPIVALFQLVSSIRQGNLQSGILLVVILGAIVPLLGLGLAKEYLGFGFGSMAEHLMEMSFVLEAFLFTLALAYQINISKWRELATLQELNSQSELAKKHLLETIDNDRTRLASDLHDSAGQMLGLISSRLKGMYLSDDIGTVQARELQQTTGMVSEVLDEIRNISHDLHPATLSHLGLENALQSLCQNMSHSSETHFTANLNFDESVFDSHQSLQIFRIFQEMMANTVRHSTASTAKVGLATQGSRVELKFNDNGRWEETTTENGGIGRVILIQRITSLSGHLTQHTGQHGTEMIATFDAATKPKTGQEC